MLATDFLISTLPIPILQKYHLWHMPYGTLLYSVSIDEVALYHRNGEVNKTMTSEVNTDLKTQKLNEF